MHRTALPQTSAHSRMFLVTALCTVNVITACLLLWPVRHLMPWDLPNFYFAGQLVATGHADALYRRAAYIPMVRQLQREDERAASRHAIYFNRPAWEALLFLPLALLSYANASRFVVAANLLLIGLLVWLLPKWFPSPWLTRPWLIIFILSCIHWRAATYKP